MGFKILNFNIFGGFKKEKYFLGYEDFVDIFLGCHHKIGLYLGVISMQFRSFLKGKVQNGGYFLRFLKFQTFLGIPEILGIFLG